MEQATNYVQNFLSGYRVPDFSKLWRKSETSSTDGNGPQEPPVPILIRLESYLVYAQELALWISPASSLAALTIVQVVYWYLAYTSSTVLNLTAWACILGFVYTTWTNRIWPEIRVEQPLEEAAVWTPVRPEVFSAPELVQLTQAAKEKLVSGFVYLRDLRTTNPGKFCIISCFAFSLVGYIGAHITALGLFYYTAMSFLTIPGLVRVVCQHHPEVVDQLRAFLIKPEPQEVVKKEEPAVEEKPPAALSNVYSKVQAQLASMVSSLSPAQGDGDGDGDAKHDEVDDLQEYLPEVNDEQTQKILDEGADMHDEVGHSQEDETSLEFSSLMTGLGPVMPDVEEVDSARPLLPVTSLAVAAVAPDDDDDDSDFLPTVDRAHRNILADELNDDEDNSAMYFMKEALSEAAASLPIPGLEESEEIDREDFEFISEDELAEASTSTFKK